MASENQATPRAWRFCTPESAQTIKQGRNLDVSKYPIGFEDEYIRFSREGARRGCTPRKSYVENKHPFSASIFRRFRVP